MRKKLAALLFPVFVFPALFAQSTDNTLYVKQFPGPDVGSKVARAQAACNPNAAIPCIIVFDPTLAAFPTGTLPTQCSQCQWMDFRSGLPYVAAGAGSGYGTKAPFLDVTTYGAKCDGTTDDSVAIQSALNAWKAGRIILTNPTGATCVIRSNITVSFNSSPSGPLTIDTRGGRWLFEATSGTDIHFVIGATNVYVSGLNLDHANFEDAGAGASVLVDVDGSTLANTGLSKVGLTLSRFIADGYTTTGFQSENTFQSSCLNSGFYAPYGSISSAVLGHYGFYLNQPGGGAATADWTLTRCESYGFDHGIYTNGVNEVKIDSGTYLLAFEENIDLNNATASLLHVHSENAWDQNASGLPSSPAQMASVRCIGDCTVTDLSTANETAFGHQNSSVLVYSGTGQQSTVSGGTPFSSETVFAYLGTGVGAEIDVSNIPIVAGLSSYSQYTGSGGIFLKTPQNLYQTNQSAALQWVQTGGTTSTSGFTALMQSSGGAPAPEAYFGVRYSATDMGVGGFYMDGNHNWNFDWCSDLTGYQNYIPIGVPTCGAGSNRVIIKPNGNGYQGTIDFSNIYSGGKNFQFDPNGGIAPMFSGTTAFATGGIPKFASPDGHLSNAEYDSSNPLPANFLPVTLISQGAGAPAGSCGVGAIYTNTSASSLSTVLYVCYPANTWNAVTVP